ncbi:hypothetical protein FA13DRAFT_1732115 [Coprinellus micaceus]|uniref:Uncharacterized protein n=1 Tax=Coprinellus micaceus TaxID=71717 RepID=A0A4Y7TD02_COPMI|nr:hypothetical protein FA13DRAFT_1732115 [Coprinellus micaceus]
MQTRSGKEVRYVDQRRKRPLQAEGTRVEIRTSATGEGTHTRWIRPPQPQPLRQETTMPSPSLNEQSSQAFITPSPHIPTEPPRGSPLQKQQRIGNPGIFNLGEDGGRVLLESQPSSDAQGLDQIAYTARQHALAAKRDQGGRRPRPLVGPTGTFIMPRVEPEEPPKQPAVPPPAPTPHPPNRNSPAPSEHLSQPLGPNGTHLISLEESQAGLGPEGTQLIFP